MAVPMAYPFTNSRQKAGLLDLWRIARDNGSSLIVAASTDNKSGVTIVETVQQVRRMRCRAGRLT